MSRSNKPRQGKYDKSSGGGHGYRYMSNTLQWVKHVCNRWMRHEVKERMKDLLFTDGYDEDGLPEKVEEVYDRWYWD